MTKGYTRCLLAYKSQLSILWTNCRWIIRSCWHWGKPLGLWERRDSDGRKMQELNRWIFRIRDCTSLHIWTGRWDIPCVEWWRFVSDWNPSLRYGILEPTMLWALAICRWAFLKFCGGVGHFLVLKDELRAQLLDKGEDWIAWTFELYVSSTFWKHTHRVQTFTLFEDTLRRIWAFNRVPGARQVIEEFILQQNILETWSKHLYAQVRSNFNSR